ncbi:MAG: hypothetical protein FWF24_00175 [Alphaproteobacteria bacterium]|nr:hypothetical protein [Alphaproteobacteria bacterium]
MSRPSSPTLFQPSVKDVVITPLLMEQIEQTAASGDMFKHWNAALLLGKLLDERTEDTKNLITSSLVSEMVWCVTKSYKSEPSVAVDSFKSVVFQNLNRIAACNPSVIADKNHHPFLVYWLSKQFSEICKKKPKPSKPRSDSSISQYKTNQI